MAADYVDLDKKEENKMLLLIIVLLLVFGVGGRLLRLRSMGLARRRWYRARRRSADSSCRLHVGRHPYVETVAAKGGLSIDARIATKLS